MIRVHGAWSFPGESDACALDSALVQVISSVNATDRDWLIRADAMGVVRGSSARAVGDDLVSTTVGITARIVGLAVGPANWVVVLVSACVFAAVSVSLVEIAGLVGKFGHSCARKLTLVFVGDFVNPADWQVDVRADAFLALLSGACSVGGLVSASAFQITFVFVGVAVSTADSLDVAFTEEAGINACCCADAFV